MSGERSRRGSIPRREYQQPGILCCPPANSFNIHRAFVECSRASCLPLIGVCDHFKALTL